MTELKFRAAKIEDLAAIVAMLADDILGKDREDSSTPPNPRYVSALQAIIADPNQMQVVAELNGELVGTMQLSFIPGIARMGAWRGQIEGVRTRAGHRGAGIGQAMFEWAIEECRQRGCSLVQLTTDKDRPDAHRFYEKLGFVATHLGYKLKLGA
ncbi:GNAT family N-acetyltransferase [Agrobacterium sp. AGB01]|jgi:GNAT superfamily N-acetyltransferase|uniref:GNAT family N-acetyltransferase n=1 Tax=Agrobacterium sp. AGB01 TaxID=2769302 RepID=UPI0017869EE6|nr:GNAT family N-acetyltransferase [Agrobacterium sp. AGB01]MBD9387945.1 GNAT family N-acetyltransferase [Agrobacterium sp. AGB01]